MTARLSDKRREFLERMRENKEQLQWGFELILQRPDYPDFFDPLRSFGFFAPDQNPTPIEVENGKYFQVPYWSALSYLTACAKLSGEKGDQTLAKKVLRVVREVSLAKKANQGNPDNYHTDNAFAAIMGYLPPSVIGSGEIELIPIWLNTRFGRAGMVARALDQGLMRRLVAGEATEDLDKAIRVLTHCTELTWVGDKRLNGTGKKAASLIDDYWLKDLINHYASALGAKTGPKAADVFLSRLRAVYGTGDRSKASWLFRPAVEEHEQNHEWGEADNRFVEGLRDALLAWTEKNPEQASSYIRELLVDSVEIVRRVALYIVDHQWESFRALLTPHLQPALFTSGHLHELYNLLRSRFGTFSPAEKNAVVAALRRVTVSEALPDPERALKRIQRNWLSAIVGAGSTEADKWYAQLNSDSALGRISEHPDFLSYMTSWSGPGRASLPPEEIVALARDGTLVEKLNAFEPDGSWQGPTKGGLVNAVQEAVTQAPDVMLTAMPTFVESRRAYQYGLIAGFKRLWDSSQPQEGLLTWQAIWSVLIEFFENLLNDDVFWSEPTSPDDGFDMTPTRDWIPPLISDFLRSGTLHDERAYDVALLPRTWRLVTLLVARSPGISEVTDDAMTEAINSPKGKAIEAMFSHALRRCRVADRENGGNHSEEWTEIQAIMDRQATTAHGANFEFSILAAAYLANIEYMNKDWLQANVERIFAPDSPENFRGAIAGLVFSPPTRLTTRLLTDSGVTDKALKLEAHGDARQRLIERIALAYLWGDEALDSPRFNTIFKQLDDLRAVSDYFWSVQNQGLTETQIERILAFLRRCMSSTESLPTPPAELLSHLSRLSVYIHDLNAETGAWLERIAPYAGQEHSAYEFVDQLLRLADSNPQIVCSAFKRLAAVHRPFFDYEDKYKRLVQRLADKGLRPQAIELANDLRAVDGMRELYERLISEP